jgi:hypothetical protein
MNFRTHRYAPVLALLVLSPLVAEVLFGATPISNLGAILPDIAVYGCGAILVRELARSRGPGFGRIALLGAAYAIVEEGLALQSMFNPDLFNAGIVGGRAFGINWVWSEWTIGYHIVWSISIPILLSELLFSDRRTEQWLGKVGMAAVGIIYALGVIALAAIFRLFVAPGFRAPAVLDAGAALLAVMLVALALFWPLSHSSRSSLKPARNVPPPWMVGLFTFLAAGAWFELLDLPHSYRGSYLVVVPMLLFAALAAGVVILVREWSTQNRAWSDLHSLALAFGAMLVSMLWGFIFVTAGSRVDQLGQGIASIAAIVLLALFARRLQDRDRVTTESRRDHESRSPRSRS